MKITEQDIIRTARQLRDEENAELHIRPWNRRARGLARPVHTWLVAVPAAAIIGFVLGFWTRSNSAADAPLTALADTIYIKVRDSIDNGKVEIEDGKPKVEKTAPRRNRRKPSTVNGRPVADDHIRYDLLVSN